MNAVQLLAHYEQIADAPDAIVRLRRFILDLAVRGKLVEQDPADEPASELLKRIATEKARLVKTGDIKKPKPIFLPEDTAIPVPANWRVVPLGEVINSHLGGGTPSKNNHAYWGGDIRWASVKDVGKSKYLDETIDRITNDGLTNSSSNLIQEGNLIVVTRMGLGQLSINRVPVAINQDLRALFLSPFLDIDFVYNFFLTYGMKGSGLTVKGIKIEELLAIPFPLPPLAEQRRIVGKVEELMALCDRLEAKRVQREATRDRLAAASLARLNAPDPDPAAFQTNAAFVLDNLAPLTTRPDQIKQLRQTILNLAVRGKLVDQDPTDEPVAASLAAVGAKRDHMVKKKELRREKPLNPVEEGDEPFRIPSTWQWVRVGKLALFTQYGTSAKAAPSETGIPVLTMGNIQDGAVVRTNEKRIPETSDELPALYLKNLDLLYNRTNSAELVGKTGLYRGDDDCLTFASYLIRIRLGADHTSPIYVNLAMNAPDFRETQIVPHIKKQTGQANVSGSALKNMLIPLPPLDEQHRIVAKVDELMALCDRLEAALTTADTTRQRLLEALLHEALLPSAIRKSTVIKDKQSSSDKYPNDNTHRRFDAQGADLWVPEQFFALLNGDRKICENNQLPETARRFLLKGTRNQVESLMGGLQIKDSSPTPHLVPDLSHFPYLRDYFDTHKILLAHDKNMELLCKGLLEKISSESNWISNVHYHDGVQGANDGGVDFFIQFAGKDSDGADGLYIDAEGATQSRYGSSTKSPRPLVSKIAAFFKKGAEGKTDRGRFTLWFYDGENKDDAMQKDMKRSHAFLCLAKSLPGKGVGKYVEFTDEYVSRTLLNRPNSRFVMYFGLDVLVDNE